MNGVNKRLMVKLAKRENNLLLRGMEILGTPYSTYEHTNEHMKFEPKVKKHKKVIRKHIKAELIAQAHRYE